MSSRKFWIGGIIASFLVCGVLATPAGANPTNGTFFYTTFSAIGGGPVGNQQTYVFKVNYSWDGTNFTLSGNTRIAGPSQGVNGADGIVFSTNGQLIVGSGDSSININQITTTGTLVAQKNTAGVGVEAEHLSFNTVPTNPNGLLYISDNTTTCGNQCMGAVQLAAGVINSNESLYAVSGGATQELKSVIFDPDNGKYYFGTARDASAGTFGTAAINDGAKTTVLTDLSPTLLPGDTQLWSHGLVYDPFSKDIFLVSANEIQQYDPTAGPSGAIVSRVIGPVGAKYDQAAVDGAGHLFVASNEGTVTFIDYDSAVGKLISNGTTKSVAGNAGFVDNALPNTLDAIALPQAVNPPVPEPASLALVGTGLVFAARMWRKKKNGQKNPVN